MEIKDVLQKVEKQFNYNEFNKKQTCGGANHNDVLRYPKILELLKKIKQNQKLELPKDFSLIDLGCGYAGVLKEIKKEFPDSNLYGVDIFPIKDVKEVFKFYRLDFMELLKSDFQCDVALMLNLYHHPGAFYIKGTNNVNDERVKHFLKELEKGISSHFDYFITMLNQEQYNSFKSGVSPYANIKAKILFETKFNNNPFTVIKFYKKL